jgi:hypothetical protein
MNLARILALKGCYQIEQLVRLVAAGRIVKRTVDQFLQHEMPVRVLGERGFLKDQPEVFDAAMQVPGHQYVAGLGEIDAMAVPARRRPESYAGLAQGVQKSGWIRHDEDNELSAFVY